MEKYEPGEYTEGVLESVRVLRDQSKQQQKKKRLFFLLEKTIKYF